MTTIDNIANEIECPNYVLTNWLDDQMDLPVGPHFSEREAGRIINRALAAGLRDWDLDAEDDDEQRWPSYDAYLRSEHWRQLRSTALDYYGNSCCLCGETDAVELHHRRYEDEDGCILGREGMADLTVLCKLHHSEYHED